MEAASITLIVSSVTASVSVATCFIARAQMKIASAKIKLDLYNKRFSIYLTALEYYQAALSENKEDMIFKSVAFIKSYREALFLFDPKDGVHDTLGRIQQSGATILSYKKAVSTENWPVMYNKGVISGLNDRSNKAYKQFDEELKLLEQQLAKYIQFKAVSGWGNLG
ncbi:hypothetical protein [Pseudomonas viridiflava]|uniref:hypothetical protein n=1 Tax=Pseudomonas viridiflava TaxID=33069 RepID=UPI000F011097|nr:hypothetical protein [Pseudomonas viridiflava]